MNHILVVVLALFGLGAGYFIGCGNFAGALGAIAPGVIAGLVLAIPMLRERHWVCVGIIVACTLIGSLVCSQVSDSNAFKQWARNQTNLHVRVGSFELGKGSSD